FHENKNLNFSDIGIIYRTHGLTRVVKKKLRESGIPFQIVGEGSMYETSIFDFVFKVLCFTYINDVNTIVELFRTKQMGISESLIKKLFKTWEGDVLERIQIAIDQKELNIKTANKLADILKNLKELV